MGEGKDREEKDQMGRDEKQLALASDSHAKCTFNNQ